MSDQEFSLKEDWAENLQTDLAEYMHTLYDSLYDGETEVETLSGEVFCGCETCEIREMLFFVSPKIINGYKDGNIWLLPSES